MEALQPPRNLLISGRNNNWKQFRQMFLLYLEAIGLSTATESRKIAIFLNCAGTEGVEIYNAAKSKDGDQPKVEETLDDVLELFDNYSEPRKGLTIHTYELLRMKQEEQESIDHFITRTINQAKKCELGELFERMTIMVIIIGCKDTSIKERLLRLEQFDLKKATELCRTVELGKDQVNIIEGQNRERLDMIRRMKQKECNYCGKIHLPKACPAYGRKCKICNKYNHFASMCRNKNKSYKQGTGNKKEKKIHEVAQDRDCSSASEDYNLDVILKVKLGGLL
ncbi:uncharacterized protein LOC135079623 [Ostrinia nubilalis]|uniref:uncharacterized protein LOC135079623 n=1 Tax=Ostrinia nubilalis TaxID=29057 RepID=UPI0030825C59